MSQISLYRKMNDNLKKKLDIGVSIPKISYLIKGEYKEIVLDEKFDGVLTINEFDSMWSPVEHNLEIRLKFSFINPSVLYGENGVTMPGNKIGLAVHMHSRTSNFQKTVKFGTIPNINQNTEIDFYYDFPVSALRGDLDLDFFIYLQECKVYNPKQATKVGMILSQENIHNLVIVVDGEGSSFPMSEFEDKDGPLWRLDRNWVEANIDTFDSSNVNLSLNIAHPLFEKIKEGKQTVSRALMGDILVQAMTLIIQQVIIVDEESIDEPSEVLPDSILAAVLYWVSTFDIDTSSLFSISNSMKAYWDRKMIDGGKSHD